MIIADHYKCFSLNDDNNKYVKYRFLSILYIKLTV